MGWYVQVLAAAASNVAVDNLVERLTAAEPKLVVVRVGHPARLLPQVRQLMIDGWHNTRMLRTTKVDSSCMNCIASIMKCLGVLCHVRQSSLSGATDSCDYCAVPLQGLLAATHGAGRCLAPAWRPMWRPLTTALWPRTAAKTSRLLTPLFLSCLERCPGSPKPLLSLHLACL